MEKETQRSGLDRRNLQTDVTHDRRKKIERRAVLREYAYITKILKKISLFKGFTEEQYMKILRLCSFKSFAKGCYIYHKGEKANEIFILLKGELKISFVGHSLLTRIHEVGLVGEIGVLAGASHLTSMITATNCTLIKINKIELFRLFENDCVLSNRVLMNVVRSKYYEIIDELLDENPTLVLL